MEVKEFIVLCNVCLEYSLNPEYIIDNLFLIVLLN